MIIQDVRFIELHNPFAVFDAHAICVYDKLSDHVVHVDEKIEQICNELRFLSQDNQAGNRTID